MVAFSYKAIDHRGRTRSGIVDATSSASARRALREQRMMPLKVEAATRRTQQGSPSNWTHRFSPAINGKTLALITRQIATLTDAGVRLDDALSILAKQCTRPATASLLFSIRTEISEGRSLSWALAEHPRCFSTFYIASVAAAEDSNRMGPVFNHLADQVETQQRNAQTIQLALLYPALLAVVSLVVILLLLTYVVPDIARAFTSRGESLPFLTRAMIGLGDGAETYGWIVPLFCGALAIVGRQMLATSDNRLRWHRFLATARLTRGPVQRLNAARFTGVLATTIQSGVDLPRALAAAKETATNLFLRSRIDGVIGNVEQGASLHRAMTEAGCFPPMLLAMVASGETSAALGPSLARAAADQQRELDAWVAALVALVEPGVLLIMGGFVLLMVLSILLPIVGLNELARSGL